MGLVAGFQTSLGMSDATFITALRGFATVMTLVSIVLLVWAIRTMRQPRRLRWFAPVLGLVGSLGGSALYMALMQPPVNPRLAVPLLAVGVVLGFLQGWQTKLYWQSEALMARRTSLYLVLWGLAYLATLGLAQLQNAAFHAVGILTMLLTVGIALGSNVNLSVQHLGCGPGGRPGPDNLPPRPHTPNSSLPPRRRALCSLAPRVQMPPWRLKKPGRQWRVRP
jgi:hypothetical protein